MRLTCCSLLLIGMAMVVVVVATEIAADEQEKLLSAKLNRQTFQPEKIIDFEVYKRLFGKHYELPLEVTVRRKYLLARAHRAWITALKYKFRQVSFYLAINHLSDHSPEELRRMGNHRDSWNTNNSLILGRLEADEEIQLVSLVRGNTHEMQLANVRKKRNVHPKTNQQPVGERKFNFNKLIHMPRVNFQLATEIASNIEMKPASNNPYYEAPELVSMGVRTDDIEELQWFKYKPASHRQENSQRSHSMSDSDDDDDDHHDADDGHSDEVFFDHRDSKCMFFPLDQGKCGSCYAFAGMAIAEWLYCKQTGKLVAFSEQYLIDCGKPRLLKGCDGGDAYSVAEFIHNYGLELALNYPYNGKDNKCPYNEDTSPKSMGYIRMDLGSGVYVPLDRFEEVIPYGPMFLTISIDEDFYQYGGGILEQANCEPEPPATADLWHAVTLIGHGREDGQEYWLIRNSHGTDWGEEGHAKMAKGSGCIFDRVGVLYGTKNGKDVEFEANENAQYVAFKKKRSKKKSLSK